MPSRAGSPNKNKAFLLNRLQDMYGEDFHPILKMAANAVEVQALVDSSEEKTISGHMAAINAWEQIAQYTEPKLKAVEGNVGVNGSLTITWSDNASPDTV